MADLTKDELDILRGQARVGNGWGVMIARNELWELLRVYQAVMAAPEVWAGCRNGEWFAGADWRDSDHVKLHLSGFGTEDEQARISTTRARLVPTTPTNREQAGGVG